MARIELEVEHSLSPESALARMHALGEYYQNHYGAHVVWSAGSCDIQVKYVAIKLAVKVRVDDRRVHCEGPDPGFLLRKRGTEYLRKKIARYLDPAVAIESLPRG